MKKKSLVLGALLACTLLALTVSSAFATSTQTTTIPYNANFGGEPAVHWLITINSDWQMTFTNTIVQNNNWLSSDIYNNSDPLGSVGISFDNATTFQLTVENCKAIISRWEET